MPCSDNGKYAKLKNWINQPSTKKGLIAILATIWIIRDPTQFNEVMMGLVALYGLYQTVRVEKQDGA